MKGELTLAEQKPKDERDRDERNGSFENFKDFVKKIAQVPKEELNEKLAEEKREKRAG